MLNQMYELYQGKKLIMTGTLRGLSEVTGLFQGSLQNYGYPKYLERTKDSETALRLFKVSDPDA